MIDCPQLANEAVYSKTKEKKLCEMVEKGCGQTIQKKVVAAMMRTVAIKMQMTQRQVEELVCYHFKGKAKRGNFLDPVIPEMSYYRPGKIKMQELQYDSNEWKDALTLPWKRDAGPLYTGGVLWWTWTNKSEEELKRLLQCHHTQCVEVRSNAVSVNPKQSDNNDKVLSEPGNTDMIEQSSDHRKGNRLWSPRTCKGHVRSSSETMKPGKVQTNLGVIEARATGGNKKRKVMTTIDERTELETSIIRTGSGKKPKSTTKRGAAMDKPNQATNSVVEVYTGRGIRETRKQKKQRTETSEYMGYGQQRISNVLGNDGNRRYVLDLWKHILAIPELKLERDSLPVTPGGCDHWLLTSRARYKDNDGNRHRGWYAYPRRILPQTARTDNTMGKIMRVNTKENKVGKPVSSCSISHCHGLIELNLGNNCADTKDGQGLIFRTRQVAITHLLCRILLSTAPEILLNMTNDRQRDMMPVFDRNGNWLFYLQQENKRVVIFDVDKAAVNYLVEDNCKYPKGKGNRRRVVGIKKKNGN